MARSYLPNRNTENIAHFRSGDATERKIPISAKLYDLKDASQKLTEQFGGGYSVNAIRRWVRNGNWIEGWHYTKRGRMVKVYLPAVQEWVVSGGG